MRHHGAMERGSKVDAAIDAIIASLARRKMVTRPTRGCQTALKWVKIERHATNQKKKSNACAKDLKNRAHFPF